jgi:hypothetical protein
VDVVVRNTKCERNRGFGETYAKSSFLGETGNRVGDGERGINPTLALPP